MKRFFNTALLLIMIALGADAYAQSRVITPKGKFDSRFLIVIDKGSFEAVQEEVLEYKAQLESEGLGAVVLVGDWKTPDELKAEIVKLYNKKPVLEGAVFVGNIPVARIQNFQHATTAFKMDEVKFPKEECSVTSDRFYDDLDLQFEFMCKDEKNPLHYYYKLKESSPQVITSDFYSARMAPPTDKGTDPKVLLKKYLKKVVAAHKENNPMDQLIIFNGHGYNSDCLTAWQNEQFAIKEQIPLAFKTSKGNGFYNYRQDPYMKYRLYDKMQQSGTDMFVFHEHGAPDTQYINGEYPASNTLEISSEDSEFSFIGGAGSAKEDLGPMSAMAISLRNTYRRYKGERAARFKKEVMTSYGYTESFFDKNIMESTRVSDSIAAADINIVLSDLAKVKMQPKLTIFDACYNGSFHQPGYVAGYHVFGDGNTIVAQGNTVNVLQDKWVLENVGMLAEGARVGFWQKEFQYLESHMIGDPTFHFTAQNWRKLNKELAVKTKEVSLWENYLANGNVNMQNLAIKMLSKNNTANFSDRLLKIFKQRANYSTRMEVLKRLLDLGDANMVEAIRLGLDDPYELIRRISARYAAFSGDPVLITPLVNNLIFANESQRVQYTSMQSLEMFEAKAVIAEIEKQVNSSNLMDKNKTIKDLCGYYTRQEKSRNNALSVILDKSAKAEDRLSAIRNLRNNTNHQIVESLLSMLKDKSDDVSLRISMAEALGWFNLSIRKNVIADALKAVYSDPASSPELKAETQQSLKRICKMNY